MPPFARTVREDPSVTAEFDRLAGIYPRFEDWWESGWKWRLARDPLRDATAVPGSNPAAWLLKTSARHADLGFPFTVTFLYTFDDNYVDLIAVRCVLIPTPGF